jgi:RNA polymerase sigma-70 factor (ECF subfamily)
MDLDAAVRDLAPRLIGYCLLRTGDRALAEDLAQESLAALVRHWRRRGPPDSPAAFVFAIARRRTFRALLRRRLFLPLDVLRDGHAGAGNPETELLERAERSRVARAMSRLAPKDREVLLLCTVGELTLQEAAAMLGISLSAAKMRALRARGRLRDALEKDDGTGPGR